MTGISKSVSEIIEKPTARAERQQIAADIVASLNRRGIPAAEVVFSGLENQQAFILRQVENLTEAAKLCKDSDVRKLMIEIAARWLQIAK
jgi:hypothetical protein